MGLLSSGEQNTQRSYELWDSRAALEAREEVKVCGGYEIFVGGGGAALMRCVRLMGPKP